MHVCFIEFPLLYSIFPRPPRGRRGRPPGPTRGRPGPGPPGRRAVTCFMLCTSMLTPYDYISLELYPNSLEDLFLRPSWAVRGYIFN